MASDLLSFILAAIISVAGLTFGFSDSDISASDTDIIIEKNIAPSALSEQQDTFLKQMGEQRVGGFGGVKPPDQIIHK